MSAGFTVSIFSGNSPPVHELSRFVREADTIRSGEVSKPSVTIEARSANPISYFVCCFIGNALPVIGVGVISAYAGMPFASTIFAGMIVLFALVALIFGVKYTR